MSLINFDPSKYRTSTTQSVQPNQDQGRFGDVVDSFQAGAASGLGGIFDFVGADGIAKSLYGIADEQNQQMSQRGQEAMAKQMFVENEDGDIALGDGITDLDTWLLQMANVAGQFVPTAIPGAGAAGLATKALSLGAKGKKVAQAIGMGSTGGAAATGQAMDQARQEILTMSDKVLGDSAIFANKFLEVDELNPELDDVAKWNKAKADLAEQVASEVRADPKVLLANFGASAIGDPIIGRALTGARLAKSGAFRSAIYGGITEGSTEALQAGTSQYGVDDALSKIDNRDAMANVKTAALNEGVIGGAAGGAAGFTGGLLNRVPKEPVTNPNADAIRDTNPGLAGAMDAMAQQEADRKGSIAPGPAPQQPIFDEAAAAQAYGFNDNGVNLDQPAAARRAGMGDTMQAGSFGDQVIAKDNANRGRSFPVVPGQPLSRVAQGVQDAQALSDNRVTGEWLPPESQGRQGVSALLEQPSVDSETLAAEQARNAMAAQDPTPLTQSSTIFGTDGRPMQAATEFAQDVAREVNQQPKQITDKNIIFADDQSGVTVKGNGSPFGSAKEALSSKKARQAKRDGIEIEAVKLPKGYGWAVADTVKKPEPAQDLSGERIDNEWTRFADDTQTLNIPRAEMPQIKSEHRGAMVNFMNARGVVHAKEEVQADSLKPTQAEFSPEKVKKAMGFTDNDRSILVSSDNYVLDGHHQWLAKRENKQPIKVIRLDAPIKELVTLANEFPSSSQEGTNTNDGTKKGTTTKVFTPTNKEIETEYQLVDASQLVPSHDFGGKVNPLYPSERQPRDRSRASSDTQITAIAKNPNPTRLVNSAESDRGAPIVSDGNVVESGNGRSIGLIEAYKRGTATAYKQYLTDNAAEFGLNADDIANMQAPVLVRKRLTPMTPQELQAFTVDSNKSASLGMSPMEQARVDADLIDDHMLSQLSIPDDGNVMAPTNRSFVTMLTKKLSTAELGEYLQADGTFNKDFVTRVERAIFAKGYDNDNLLELVAESTTAELKNVTNSLANVAGRMSELRSLSLDTWQQLAQIYGDATNLVFKSRRTGKSISELVSQGDMMAGYVPSEVQTMAIAIDATMRSGKKMTALFDSVITSLVNANSGQADVFSGMDATPLTPQEAISYVKQSQQQQAAPKQGSDLFGANPPRLERGDTSKATGVQRDSERSDAGRQTETQGVSNSDVDPDVLSEAFEQAQAELAQESVNTSEAPNSSEPKSRKVHGWDRVELSKHYTADELDAWIKELSNDPDNQNKDGGIHQLDTATRKKIDALSWAVYYLQKEQKQESSSKITWTKRSSRVSIGSNGMIIADESYTANGNRLVNIFIYHNADDYDKGKLFTSAESIKEAKQKAQLEADKLAANNTATPKPTEKPVEAINDFGEKLGGAKKDVWGGFDEAIKDQQNTTELPLSRSWPEPDYKALAYAGADKETLALIAAMRAEIPVKPRLNHKVKRWADNVNMLKGFANSLLNGALSKDEVLKGMSVHSGNLKSIVRTAKVIAKADIENLKSVSDFRIKSGDFGIFNGVKYSPSKTIYFISRNGRNDYKSGSEKLADVEATLERIVKQEQSTESKGKQSKIGVYSDRLTKQVFLGWKGSSGVLRIQNFETTTEARDYLKDNRQEVEDKLAKIKSTPNERRAVNNDRVGPEHFAGNVTPEIFTETFGFRGVEFGNWVEQGKRQKDLNQAYDGLMDLADLLGVEPMALSLDGELGLAFGARGSGGANPAAAHYEPGKVVINLTKKNGAGSLAHEWYHALDNYLSKKRGDKGYVSERTYELMNKGIRKEVIDAFKGVRDAINASGMVGRAMALDSRRSKGYWAKSYELSARSFESFVISELERKGFANDYLANIQGEDGWLQNDPDIEDYPYPTAEEQPAINAAYQQLFDTLETRKTDKGIEFYSKDQSPKREKGKLSRKLVDRVIDKTMTKLNGGGGIMVKVINTIADFEQHLNLPSGHLGNGTIFGAYDEKRHIAYVIAESHQSAEEVRQTVVHEVLAHGGLQKTIGGERYQSFIDRILASKNKKDFADVWAKIDEDYDGASDRIKAEEVFANFVQNQPEKGSLKHWWNALLTWLRRQLEQVGALTPQSTKNDMLDMIDAITQGFAKERDKAALFDDAQADVAYSQSVDKFSKKDNSAFLESLTKAMNSKATNIPLIQLGSTPELLIALGVPELPLAISRDTVRKATNGIKHTVSMEDIEQLPALLSDPVAIFKSASTGKVVLIDTLDANGDPVIVAIHVNKKDGRLLINQIASAYGKENAKTILKKWELEYLNKSKNPDLVRHLGLIPRSGSPEQGLPDNYVPSGDNVNDDLLFSKTTAEPDTRTAKEKLGLTDKIEDSVAQKIKDTYHNTADTLKSASFWDRLNEGIFDNLSGIKNAEEKAGITDPNKMGYVSARLASGLADVLHGVFHYGAPVWKDGVMQRKADTKGLLEVFGMLPDDKLNNWLAWMGANRAKQLMALGRENNLTNADIDELLALADGNEALFEEVRTEYNKINSAVLDVAQEAGLISEAQRGGFDEDYYVPFFREQDVDPEMQDIASMVLSPYSKKGLAGQSAKIKELKGGKQSTKDLLENIIHRQSTLIDAALKNKAMLEVTDNLAGTDYMESVDSEVFKQLSQRELNSIHRVKVMRDGKAETYAVSDPALLRGLISVNDIGSSALFNRMGRAAKRFLTTGVTLSPDFIFKNFIRDAAHAWMINKDGFKLGTDSMKGLNKAFKEDEAYRDLIFSGAAFQGGYIHGADPEAASQQIRRALAAKGLAKGDIDGYMKTLVGKGSTLLEKYRNASDKVENANRLATYEAALAKGKSRRQAAYEAKDLMDYSLKGNFALISTMIDFLPFFNARLQGMSKLVRASKAGDGDKVLKYLSANLAMKGMKVAAVSLALAAMNDDDDRYKELPDWDKDANWHFWLGDDHWRIPKPFELGIVFGTMPERLFAFGSGSQTGNDLGKATAHAIFNTLALNPVPQIALPMVEVMTNKSFFKDSPIEGMGDERRLPGDRYSAYTSDVAREIGQAFNVSPKKIEHIIKGYTGTMGGYVLGMADVMARQMLGKMAPETPLSRYPVIKAVYGGDDPQGSTYYQDEFYKALDTSNQVYGSYKRAMEERDSEYMVKLLEDNRNKLGVRIALNRVQRQVSAISKQQQVINNSNLNSSEKRQKLDNLTRQKNALYQSAYIGFKLREW